MRERRETEKETKRERGGVADERGVEGERKTTGTVSENRIRGEQVTGGRDPGGEVTGVGEFPPFQPPCCRVPRTAARRYTYTLGVYILYPVYPSCR